MQQQQQLEDVLLSNVTEAETLPVLGREMQGAAPPPTQTPPGMFGGREFFFFFSDEHFQSLLWFFGYFFLPSVQSHLYLIARHLARIDGKKYEAVRSGEGRG